MSLDEYLPQIAVFVAIVVVIAGSVALAGALRSPPTADYERSSPSQFQPESALATVSDETGEISVPSGENKTVLIDRSHENAFAASDIEPFVSALVENGHAVRYLSSESARGSTFNDSLKKADAFVVINPTRPFSTPQLNGLEAFAEAGGRVSLFGDPNVLQSGVLGSQQLSPQTTEIASRFGVTIGSGYLYNMHTDRRDNNFKNIYARPAGNGALTSGVNRVVMWKAAPVSTSQEGSVLLRGAQGTRLSSTRDAGTYGVLARNGNVTVVGDTSILTPSSAYDASNEVLVGNLIEFLVTGEKADCIFPGGPRGFPGIGTPVGNASEGSKSAC